MTSRSHPAATCRELLSQTWLPQLPPISHRTPSITAGKFWAWERRGRSCCKGINGLEWSDTDLEGVGQTDASGCRDVQSPVLSLRWDRLSGLSWLSPGLKARSAIRGTPGSFRHPLLHLCRVWREGIVRVFIPSIQGYLSACHSLE